MSLPVLGALTLIMLGLGYRFYGGFVARQLALDPQAVTPAYRYEDGSDFVPTKPGYLLGQHFSAIAAAGPVAGPILACKDFGWLPCLLWIAVGVVFIGAVHDFTSLVASVRHQGRSIAEVVREYLGRRAWIAIMCFIWIALVYVILAFADITASTFVSGDVETAGLPGHGVRFNPGGAVAMASLLYLGLALVMGLVERYLRPPLWLQTAIFVPATLAAVWAGTKLSTAIVAPHWLWAVVILLYCFAASLTPVWALLQPRGYLGGFVLYMALAAGTIGMFFGGFEIQQPAFKGWHNPAGGALFPLLFVTIACGACSGFHGLVCSGTTSKQIARETHCRPVGYGSMLLEGFVAVIALATVMIATNAELAGKGPGAVYGMGLGRFLAVVVGEKHLLFATTFGAMAFSTFVFDTLDVSTRLGRYILQELFGLRGRGAAVAATAATCGVPLVLLLAAGEGSYKLFWTLFGTSNQLLAGLTLLALTIWLRRSGRPVWFTAVPMGFVLAVTLWSLVLQARKAFSGGAAGSAVTVMNGVTALLLIGLAVALAAEGVRAWTTRPLPAS